MKNKADLFKTYFLLLRLGYILSGILALSMLGDGLDLYLAGAVVGGLFFLGVQFYVSLHSERMILRGNYIGLVLALGLTTLMLFSFFFPLALFGFYCLLNKKFRGKHIGGDVPVWLNDGFVFLDESIFRLKAELARK